MRRFACAAVALPAFALADTGHVLNYSVGATVTRDANLFRLAPGTDTAAAIGSSDGSDTITTTTLGVAADKEIGLQRLKLDMQLSSSHFRRFVRLDNDAHNVSGSLAWAVASAVRGEVSGSSKTALSGFDQIAGTSRNLNTTKARSASLFLKLAADWEAFCATTQTESTNSSAGNQAASYLSHGNEAGLRYVSPAGHQFVYSRRRVKSTQVIEENVSANGTWMYSPFLQLAGGFGHVSRKAESGPASASGGTTGNLSLSWTPTARTRFGLLVREDVAPAVGDFAATTTLRGATLTVGWTPTAKVSMQFSRDRSTTMYSNTAIPRDDRLGSDSLSVSYLPDRALSLNLVLRSETRDSTQAPLTYRDRIGTFSAQFSF